MVIRILVLVFLTVLNACGDPKRTDLNAWTFDVKLNGGMRLERDPADAPIDADLIARNFRKIAYEFEADPFGTGEQLGDPDAQRPMIKRWEEEIRLSVILDPETTGTARRDTYDFMRKLVKITNVDFKISNQHRIKQEQEDSANLLVILGDGAFFDAFIPIFRLAASEWDKEQQHAAEGMLEFLEIWHDSYSPCAGTLYTGLAEDGETSSGQIIAATVAIRTDLVEPNTQSCIEEELAQTMGLPNDDADVKPSLFNDDDEFALMTRHDELLLRILYDQRLKAGMSPEQSMRIVRRIASELLPET